MVKNYFKKYLIPTVVAGILLIFAIIILSETTGLLRPGEEVIFEVKKGTYFNEIVTGLKTENIIGNRTFFRIYSKIFYGDDINSIISGKIKIDGKRSYKKILNSLCSDIRHKSVTAVTIPEGSNISEIKDLLLSKELINDEKFDKAVSGYDFEYEFLKPLEKKENRLEGFLFPDTYYITEDDNEITIINSMLKRFDEITSKYSSELEHSGFTLYEAVTLASIIEKESTARDYKKVSSVFNNRLKRTDNLKYLQSCATVQYLLKEKKPILSNKDIQIDSPYNTYKYPGLPVGPIASPGEKAFEAALNPEKTDYLYFQNDKNGILHFTSDYNEHLKNMELYQ